MRPFSRYLFLALLFGISTSPALAAFEECGSLNNAYGPWDYRSQKDRLVIVEAYHFDSNVEMLRFGLNGSVAGDLDYTLRASPNHHRALMSIANLALKQRSDRFQHAHYKLDCYFERAFRFAPTDGMPHMIYGTYLFKNGAKQKALEQYEMAAPLAEDNANLHYNLGLVYLDFKQYDKALAHAQRAYALGFQLPGLKNKLIAAGKWQEPPPAAEQVASPNETATAPN